MSSPERSASASPGRARPCAAAPSAAAAAAAAAAAPVQHPRSFKLRFAPQRVPGHSYQSAVRPLKLPAVVTDKFWRAPERPVSPGAETRALRTVRDMFQRGPREKHPRPVQASHEYGWWHDMAAHIWAVPRRDRRLQHHLRDSAWLKARLRVLAEAEPQAQAQAQAAKRR